MLNTREIYLGNTKYYFTDSDKTGLVYDYYASISSHGAVLITRLTKAEDECRYYLAKGTYATIWAAKATFTYVLPNAVENINFNL